MAKVTAQVIGGTPQLLEGMTTVGEVKAKLNANSHTATVNGEPADNNYELSDYEFVSLAPSVKGATVKLRKHPKNLVA